MQYLCTSCQYMTVNKKCYFQHLQNKHHDNSIENTSTATNSKYTCSLCDYQTNKKPLLKAHQTIHSELKAWQCTHCSYKTFRESNLKHHVKSIHENLRFPCELCSYTTTRNSYLKAHIKFVHLK